jgi:amino acid transporter
MAASTHTAAHDHALRREFNLWSSFAFAFISPIVALYGIFGLAISTAGPSFWWGFGLVFAGQLLVAFVFATLVSRWPIEGSIYQWSRRLLGNGYGWFAGWAYMWTLVIAMATVALGAAGFIANIAGDQAPDEVDRGAQRHPACAHRPGHPAAGHRGQPHRAPGAQGLHDGEHHRRGGRLAGARHLAAAVPPGELAQRPDHGQRRDGPGVPDAVRPSSRSPSSPSW